MSNLMSQPRQLEMRLQWQDQQDLMHEAMDFSARRFRIRHKGAGSLRHLHGKQRHSDDSIVEFTNAIFRSGNAIPQEQLPNSNSFEEGCIDQIHACKPKFAIGRSLLFGIVPKT
jgi:hypothetical protein